MVRRLPRAVAEIRDQQSAHFRARVASEVAGTPEVFVKWELVRKTFSRHVQTRFLKRCGATTYQMRSRRRTSGGEAKQAAAALP